MRRTLAGLIFGLAYVCASLAISGWLLHRSAFDPDHTKELSTVVLQDPRIRTQIADDIADAVASQRGVDRAVVRQTVLAVAGTRQGAALLGQVLHDAHADLIGQIKGPVRITGAQMVQVVRNQVVADMPAITLPVPEVTALDRIRTHSALDGAVRALFAVGFFVIGFMLHPHRSDARAQPRIRHGAAGVADRRARLHRAAVRRSRRSSDNIWADVSARLANDSLPLLVGLAIVFGAGGMMLLVGTGLLRRRRRWTRRSAPIATARSAAGADGQLCRCRLAGRGRSRQSSKSKRGRRQVNSSATNSANTSA